MSQLPNHEANHRHIHKGFAGLRHSLVILAQAALTVQPSKGALYHPSARQGHKASLTFCLLHYLQLPAQCALHPLDQLTSVTTISPYQLQTAKAPPVRVAGFLDTLKQPLEQHLASISVLDRSGGHHYQHHQPKCVHNQVPLAPRHLLACIIATLLTTFYCLDALAVHYGGAWLLVATLLLPQLLSQSGVEPFPSTVDAPQSKGVVDALPGWKVVRQRSPMAAVLHHVEDGVEYLSPSVKAWATCGLGFWHKWRDYIPFVIIEVSRVDSSGLTGTHTLSLPDCLAFG